MMTISAFLEKQKVLDWLYELYVFHTDDAYMTMIRVIEAGRFDWSGEGD